VPRGRDRSATSDGAPSGASRLAVRGARTWTIGVPRTRRERFNAFELGLAVHGL